MQTALDRFAQQFVRMPVAAVVYAPDGRAVYHNAALRRLLAEDAGPLLSRNLFSFQHESMQAMAGDIRKVLAGDVVILPPFQVTPALLPHLSTDRHLWMQRSISPILDDAGAVSHALVLFEDVTELKDAEARLREREQELEGRVRERTRELETLLETARELAATHDLEPLLDRLLLRLRGLVPHAAASVVINDGRKLIDLRTDGIDASLTDVMPSPTNTDVYQAFTALMQRAPAVTVADILEDSADTRALRAVGAAGLATAPFTVRSWAGAAIYVRGRMEGVLSLVHPRVGAFSQHDLDVIAAIASQASVAIENARLLARAEERTNELTTLLDLSRDLVAKLELPPLIDAVLDQARSLIPYEGAAVVLAEDEHLVTLKLRLPPPAPIDEAQGSRTPLSAAQPLWTLLERGEAVVLPDVHRLPAVFRALRHPIEGDRGDALMTRVHSWMAAPLALKERVIGFLSFSHSQPGFYTSRHAELAGAVANLAAIAIENARLYGEAEERAALEERQRLARELHDSVAQSIYAIGLQAKSARAWLDRDPPRAAAPLDQVVALSGAGSAEMRALILDLRPESLANEGLVAVLSRQIDALHARHEIDVTADLCPEPDVPLAVKEAVYRIGREALHNVVKHARAGRVAVTLCLVEGVLELDVQDDGAGFDPAGHFPGHLGLQSMRERASRLGGDLEITSEAGKGTRIHLRVPAGR